MTLIPLPYESIARPPAATTGSDGSASVTLTATAQLGRAGKLAGIFIQVTKPGDDVLNGLISSRLVNLTVTK